MSFEPCLQNKSCLALERLPLAMADDKLNHKYVLSIDMKTKLAWYVPRMNIEHLMLDTFKDDLLPLEDDL